jgi:hypothetical protein
MKRYFYRATVTCALLLLSAALPLLAQQEVVEQAGSDTPAVSSERLALWPYSSFPQPGAGEAWASGLTMAENAPPDLLAELTLPDAPSATDRDSGQASSSAAMPDYVRKRSTGAVPAVKGPFIDGRVADWKYHALLGAVAASTFTNTELTLRCVWDHYCDFVPPSMRRRLVLYGIYGPLDLGTAYYSYKLKKGGSRFWWVPAAVITGANTFVALHSLHRINNKGF